MRIAKALRKVRKPPSSEVILSSCLTFQNGRLSLIKLNIWNKPTWIVGGPVIALNAFRLCGWSELERGLGDVYKIDLQAKKG